MLRLMEYWENKFSSSIADMKVVQFKCSGDEGKERLINDSFGISEGKVKGNIFTYYYKISSDKKDGCYKVTYNFKTDELKTVKINWNKKAENNLGRRL